MLVAGHTLTFYHNDETLGIAFSDPFLKSDSLVPRVYLGEYGDCVKVCEGKLQ